MTMMSFDYWNFEYFWWYLWLVSSCVRGLHFQFVLANNISDQSFKNISQQICECVLLPSMD